MCCIIQMLCGLALCFYSVFNCKNLASSSSSSSSSVAYTIQVAIHTHKSKQESSCSCACAVRIAYTYIHGTWRHTSTFSRNRGCDYPEGVIVSPAFTRRYGYARLSLGRIQAIHRVWDAAVAVQNLMKDKVGTVAKLDLM